MTGQRLGLCCERQLAAADATDTDMNFQERLSDICRRMGDEKLLLLVAFHDGAHFIEKPNPVTVLSGFRSIGPAAALLFRDGGCNVIVTARWGAERAAELCPRARVVGADD